MKRKKTSQKQRSQKVRKKSSDKILRYLSLLFGVILLVLFGGVMIKAMSKVHVLGVSTGPILLADDNNQRMGNSRDNTPFSDNGFSSFSPQHSLPFFTRNGQLPSEEAPNQGGISTSSSEPTMGNSFQHPQDTTQVDCIGPDGNHFTTNFHGCQDFNNKWGNTPFNFTPLGAPQSSDHRVNGQFPEPTQQLQPFQPLINQGTPEVQMRRKGGLEETRLEIQKNNDGFVQISTHSADGSEVLLPPSALDQINMSLRKKNMEISTTSANGVTIQSSGVQAKTDIPLSDDTSTNSLAVTTPTGITDITTPPSQAVQLVLQQKILSSILSSADPNTASAGAANNTIALTEFNNKPAYAVQGVSQKKLLGLFSVAYPKTVYVSIQNGQTLQTQETFFNKILEVFSF